jgi:hypothetical protein
MIMPARRCLLFMAILAACVATALASDKYEVHDDIKMDDTRKPAAGKALVYFVRTQYMGMAISVQLVVDGKPLAWTRAGTFVVYEGDPGKHEFASISEGGALLDADLLPDRIYYVQLAIHMGAMRARSHFEVIRPGSEAGKEILDRKEELRAITLKEEGLQWFDKHRDDVQRTIARERKDKEEIEILRPEDGYEAPLTGPN